MTPEEEIEAIEIRQRMRKRKMAMAAEQERLDDEAPDEWFEDLAEGVAVSGMETYYGAKDLAGAMDDDDKATLADWKQDASESNWGTGGQIIGDIAQMAIPGGAALRGLKAAGKLKQITGKARLGADLATGTGLGYVQAPSENETRLEGATEGAGGALLGGALAGALGKLSKGINLTDDAARQIDEGIDLTPGQASNNTIWRGVENIMSMSPGTGKGVNELRDRALAQWNAKVLNDVRAPGTSQIESAIGFDGNKQLAQGFKDAYRKAWDKVEQPKTRDVIDVMRQVGDKTRRLDADSQVVVRNMMEDLSDLTNDYTPERMRQLDQSLRRAITSANSRANPNRELSNVLKEMKDGLRSISSREARDELAEIDKQYTKYMVAQKASNQSADGAGGTFSPKDLQNASRSSARGSQTFEQTAPMQEMANQGMSTLGRKEPAPIMNVRKAISKNFFSPTAGLDLGGRMMYGNTGLQKGIKGIGNSKLAEALRRMGVAPGNVASGYLNESGE